MPDDVYVNPDRTPYKGKYKWVPDTIPSAKETAALGWLSSTVERGSFRNDYYINYLYILQKLKKKLFHKIKF